MNLEELLSIALPIIQAPMAGVQGSALAVAVCNAGGLGSLPCAMLTPDAMRAELTAIHAQTAAPYNVNFFCHAPPAPDRAREAAWRAALAPWFEEFDIDRAMRELGPISAIAPEFPLAGAPMAALRAKCEAAGSGDWSPLWAGQNVGGCREAPAADVTLDLARGVEPGRRASLAR